MKHRLTLAVMSVLAILVAGLNTVSADPQSDSDRKKLGPMEIRALLEQGQANGALPKEMVIRVSACLSVPKDDAADVGIRNCFRETWEFTPDQIRRVPLDDEEDGDKEQVDAVPFDSKTLCKELLEGKALEIQTRKGTGEEVGFVGSNSDHGSRSIEIKYQGETVLRLFETNGPFLQLYRESDARAFGTLYEQLASQARTRFKPQNSEATTK